ncbi:TetR/AcrR family transcriptional regulator [Microcella daejeonensis]|uniref:TetR/AcrR family transcriptional regulator n=1 Tax=Microcella daejeonensis TaxID=2994971 RepID=A0A9E8SA12_9MICO|nr:TetR/AcrR family transcriptional regulator [Microcella daejeonensis]WAB82101.1 TetR/AcrR family transcriptional regulator [Microcella daejeonensis]
MTAPENVDPRVARTRHDVPAVALRLLLDEGWEAVTPARVAAEAGYSRATVYAHWPDRTDLIRDAFAQYGGMPHHRPDGDAEADLRGELASFCRAMVEHRLDRALATLAERAQTNPEITPIRDRFVADGERPMRQTLPALGRGPAAEAALLMLCGMVTHAVLMHGAAPVDEVLDAAVRIVVDGLRDA